VVRKHLDDFLHQTFLGIEVQYGDDRRLTQYALLEGKVLVQDTAVAYTAVPERLDHFRRQQLRWNKSFFRESVWAIRRFGPRHWAFWISLVEIVTWIAFSTSLIAAVYVRPVLTGEMIPWYYVAFATVLAYARNVRYFGRPDASLAYQATTFALAPVYALLHATLLTPMRLWALLTLRQRGWGTRGAVEVSITTPDRRGAPRASRATCGLQVARLRVGGGPGAGRQERDVRTEASGAGRQELDVRTGTPGAGTSGVEGVPRFGGQDAPADQLLSENTR
jgi:hyaluronan synthase